MDGAAWPVHIRSLVNSNKFEDAVHAVTDHYRMSLALPASVAGEPAEQAVPKDAVAAFDYYWRSGNGVTARRILDEAARQKPPVSAEIWRLKAAVSAQEGDWRNAWQNIEKYIRASGLDAFP